MLISVRPCRAMLTSRAPALSLTPMALPPEWVVWWQCSRGRAKPCDLPQTNYCIYTDMPWTVTPTCTASVTAWFWGGGGSCDTGHGMALLLTVLLRPRSTRRGQVRPSVPSILYFVTPGSQKPCLVSQTPLKKSHYWLQGIRVGVTVQERSGCVRPVWYILNPEILLNRNGYNVPLCPVI